jgi:hypothetical protein
MAADTTPISKHSIIDYSILNDRQKLSSLSKDELIGIVLMQNDVRVPLSVFLNDMAPLEALTRFLIDSKKFSIKNSALRLNRDFNTIWTTYHNAKNKKFQTSDSEYTIPLMVFAKENLSILESLVKYLHEHYSLKLSAIAKLVNRDTRTVWTCYNRSRKKLNS